MTQGDPQAREEALDWVVRLRDPGLADWDAFTTWLEADPRHNVLYEEAALADRDLGEVLAAATPLLVPSNDDPAPAPRRFAGRALAGWSAVAAAVLVAVTGYPLLQRGDTAYEVATAPGEQRSIALVDGTRIEMNGGTRLILHHDDTRVASLTGGEATFNVVHDDAKPFTVQVGTSRIQDVGTVFNVARSGTAIEVGVAEGAVLFNPHEEAITLTAGHTLQIATGSNQPVRSMAVPDSIGTWRRGRLVYRGARIARVAADVSRYLGVPITPDAAVAERTFDGVIILDHNPKRLFARLGPLLDVAAQPSSQGWRLTSLARETR